MVNYADGDDNDANGDDDNDDERSIAMNDKQREGNLPYMGITPGIPDECAGK